MDRDSFINNSGKNKIFTEWAFKFPELIELLEHIYSTAQRGYENITGEKRHNYIHFNGLGKIEKKKFYEFISLADFRFKTTKITYYKIFKKSKIDISWIGSKTNIGKELYSLINISPEELEGIYQACLRKLLEQNKDLLGKMPQIKYNIKETTKYSNRGLTYRQKQIIKFLNDRGLQAYLSHDLFASPIIIVQLNLKNNL